MIRKFQRKTHVKALSLPHIMCMVFAVMLAVMTAAVPAQAAGGKAFEGDPFAYKGKSGHLTLQSEAKSYPDSFDLRSVDTDEDGKGDTSFVTPVKLQNPFGTCWGFAAVSAAESSLLASGLAAENGLDVNTLDLSEKHLAYFATSHIDDENNPQNGEGTVFTDLNKNDLKTSAYRYNTGGMTVFATSLFASGIGPLYESSSEVLEYKGADGAKNYRQAATAYDAEGKPTAYSKKPVWYDDNDDWSIPDSYRFYQEYRLKDSFCLPSPSGLNENGEYAYNIDGVNAIKQQMYDHHRAVAISFTAESYLPGQDTSDKLYMSSNWAHYTYENAGANHSVTVVGWDDKYPKENFLEGHQPPDNGAFLIKNSWGSELNEFPNNGYRHWGLPEGLDGVPYDKDAKATSDRATGYFWISYYDRSLFDPEAFEFDKVTGDNGYYVEQHDLMQALDYGGSLLPDCQMANVFTAEDTSELSGISVMTLTPGTTVSYQVYLLSDDYEGPQDGLLLTSGEETFELGGYHRIALSDTKVLSRGQKYSVAVRENMSDGDYFSFAIGRRESVYYSDRIGMHNVAVINEKESFLFDGETWSDLSDESLQEAILTDSYSQLVMDNFPIKSYLEPVCYDDAGESKVFEGYLTINNYQKGSITDLDFLKDDSIKVSPEFRGISGDMPDTWDPEIKWSSSDSEVAGIEEYSNGSVLITGKGAGRAFVTADAGEYGTRVISVDVRKPSLAMMALSENGLSMVYTGKELTPKPVIIRDELATEHPPIDYVEGVDYVLTYENNINVGTATVTATGIGDYSGSVSDTFTITKAQNTLEASGKKATVSRKKKDQTLKRASVMTVKNPQGSVTYTKTSGSKKIRVAKSTGKVTVKKGIKKGKYRIKVKVKAAGTSNYKAKTKTVTFVIKVK